MSKLCISVCSHFCFWLCGNVWLKFICIAVFTIQIVVRQFYRSFVDVINSKTPLADSGPAPSAVHGSELILYQCLCLSISRNTELKAPFQLKYCVYEKFKPLHIPDFKLSLEDFTKQEDMKKFSTIFQFLQEKNTKQNRCFQYCIYYTSLFAAIWWLYGWLFIELLTH